MRRPPPAARQAGTTAVELALVMALFITLMLGAADMARWTLAAQGLQESARLGARVAAVCDPFDPSIQRRVRERLVTVTGQPGRTGPWRASEPEIELRYEPAGCDAATCQTVRVSLNGAALPGLAPWWGGELPLPTAWIELPRESLSSLINGRSNPQCR